MRDYFIRRFLLMIPTLIGATMIVYFIIRMAPGGPVDAMIRQSQALNAQRSMKDPGGSLTEEQKDQLLMHFKLDKPYLIGYLMWLGVLPSEEQYQMIKLDDVPKSVPVKVVTKELDKDGKETGRMVEVAATANTDGTVVTETGRPLPEWKAEPDWKDQKMVVSRRGFFAWIQALFDRAQRSQEVELKRPDQKKEASLRRLLPKKEWKPNNAYEVLQATVGTDGSVVGKDGKKIAGWKARTDWNKARIVAYRPDFEGLLQGTFRESQRYNEPVSGMMTARIPVSLFYGVISAIITYVICIPLGILKAIKHRTLLDNTTSLLIFAGYAIPAFVLGSVLAVFLAARFGWFPTGGFVSENFEELSLGGKVWDLIHHGTLPMICYLIGNFAFLTMLMKNSLLDNLAADYVRTAIAKGSGFKTAVFRHALRNSLIPIMTTLGGLVSVFVAGSILIERIFDINGFGMLSYQAILDRDLFLMMGILTVNVFLIMLGNILSDYFVALMDPRIRFD